MNTDCVLLDRLDAHRAYLYAAVDRAAGDEAWNLYDAYRCATHYADEYHAPVSRSVHYTELLEDEV